MVRNVQTLLLDKLRVTELVKKSLVTFYGNRTFITILVKAHHQIYAETVKFSTQFHTLFYDPV